MILLFPDADTLRLVLSGSLLPSEVMVAPARFSSVVQGPIAVETALKLPKKAMADLARLGVEPTTSHSGEVRDVSCWPQLLPVTRDPALPQLSTQTAVLFELESAADLPTLVTEMLRLGNDRQAVRWFKHETEPGSERVLLRVLGPPYYTLLRAVETSASGTRGMVRAFLERAPRVWVQIGFSQPFADRLKPADRQFVLVRPPRDWEFLPEGDFQDVYDLVQFRLPATPVDYDAAAVPQKLEVPVRLIAGNATDAPELWVIEGDAVDRLDAFVRDADERISQRLKFAVATDSTGKTSVVLRVAASKGSPPVLTVSGAIGFKAYYKLPNLFLPAGTRLHPTLRRDAVRKLLADDPDLVVWLNPGPDGTFVPTTLPEDAFRPLEAWVDYVIAADSAPLAAWVSASKFDFELFICSDATKPKPDEAPGKGKKKTATVGEAPLVAGEVPVPREVAAPTDEPGAPVSTLAAPSEERVPDEWVIRRKRLEEEFLALGGGLDSPARVALWPELAKASAGAGAIDDAAICWVNAMWETDAKPEFAEGWLRSELPNLNRPINRADFESRMASDDPSPSEILAFAALAFRLTFETPLPSWFTERLPAVQSYLERHDSKLPVRAVWLVATRLTKLAGADTLGLARVRDRLLLRLLEEGGLRTERDLPSFLKFDGLKDSERVRQVRDRALDLHRKVRQWATASLNPPIDKPNEPINTLAYIDLFFAFGLAKLGETSASRTQVESARRVLEFYPADSDLGIAGRFLFKAFRYRIDQALAGKPHAGPLESTLLDELDAIHRQSKDRADSPAGLGFYAIHRLREQSRILEPQEKSDPYIVYQGKGDELHQQLAELARIREPAILSKKFRDLYKNGASGRASPESRFMVLYDGLPRAARVGEAFTVELLNLVPETMKASAASATISQITLKSCQLLERAMFLAAHFERRDILERLIDQFVELVKSKPEDQRFEWINLVVSQGLRGLRKLGQRDELDRFLRRLQDLVLGGLTPAQLRTKYRGNRPDSKALRLDVWPKALQSLLNLAGGWLSLGLDDRAIPILADARAELLARTGPTIAVKDYTMLAQAYVTALGHGPVETGLPGIEEMFETMLPTLVTNTFTSAKFYSRFHLNLVEETVLAVVSDDFALGPAGRRWLDEDEQLVRRRIHRDVRSALDRSGL